MRRGFTLIELVFVIIIIGVLSAILAPRFDRPSISEATHQLVSHIRYTQHLAMMDNKFNPTQQFWYRERWHILFNDRSYTIGSNRDRVGNLISTDIARDPSNPLQFLTADTSFVGIDNTNEKVELNLQEKYGIETLVLSGGCANNNVNNRAISFDYLGRPIRGNSLADASSYGPTLMQARCVITLTTNDDDDNIRRIAIEPETGYVHTL